MSVDSVDLTASIAFILPISFTEVGSNSNLFINDSLIRCMAGLHIAWRRSAVARLERSGPAAVLRTG